jgi:REP element-mobilizing transposase RayT
MITADLQPRLYQYIGGIAKKNKMRLISIGGVEDHIHLLLSLAKTLDIAKAIQLIKGGSSKWVHDNFSNHRLFEWQEGYGAFSIGVGDKIRTVRYIDNQRRHHQKNDFKTEFLSFLDRHEIEYDLKHVFD